MRGSDNGHEYVKIVTSLSSNIKTILINQFTFKIDDLFGNTSRILYINHIMHDVAQ